MSSPGSPHPGQHHPLVDLARRAIESHLKGKTLEEGQGAFSQKAAAFVSLKIGGRLRGCIGTIQPVRESLTSEVIANAISAATRDPRFEPLTLDELEDVSISVDVLGTPEPVSGPEDLDPSRYGIIVRAGERRGVLLPDLPGVETAQDQIRIASRKAGIGPGESIELLRFEVKRYT